MADLEEASTPMDTVDNSSDSESSGDEAAPAQPIEWLATSRAKRSTAGTRMTSLIQAEAEDDELELLFAEDENDEGFEIGREGGDESDVQMDSSDDDEDQGPPAPGAEELDGEKELLRKERQERGKKRKNDHLPKSFQAKRVKIDPLAPGASKKTPPRPKKKSERASWIPTVDDAPVRVSHRSTTMDAKERLYKEMEERERKRLKQLANMERAAAKKAALKKPEKTQEDRLAEAARIEKANAKSLNRWEEAERIREEEARARLEALHNRKMEGPVITWWSGKATYVGDKLKQVGKHVQVEEQPVKVPRKKRPSEMGLGDSATAKARLERQLAAQSSGQQSGQSSVPGTPSMSTSINGSAVAQGPSAPNVQQPLQPMHATPAMLNGSAPLSGLSAPPSAPGSPFPQPLSAPSGPTPSPSTVAPQLSSAPPPLFPAGFTPLPNGNVAQAEPAPSLPHPATSPAPIATLQGQLGATANPLENDFISHTSHSASPLPTAPVAEPSAGQMPPPQNSSTTKFSPQSAATNPFKSPSKLPQSNQSVPSPQLKIEQSSPMPPSPFAKPPPQQPQPQQPSQSSLPQPQTSPAHPPMPPPPPPPTTFATTSRLILTSFHEPSLRDRTTLTAIVFRGNKFQKLPRPSAPPICAITGLPAKYRDPKTGLWYSSAYAFKEIRRLEQGEYRWSGLLGVYVGGVDRLATQPGQGGQAPGVKKVAGAATGVPARFTDPKAAPPPKVVKQEVRALATASAATPTGNMAPPPLPQIPATPTPRSGQGQQPIMTPSQFATQNLMQRNAAPQSAPAQAPNPFKQASPAMSTPNKPAAGNVMPAPRPVVQPQAPAAQRSQFAPATPGSISQAPQPPAPIIGIAKSVAPIATTVAAVAPVIATAAPIAAPVAASMVAPVAAPVPAPAPAPAQPKA